MRLLALVALSVVLLAGPAAAALPEPTITFIPAKITANGSFLLEVAPGAANARVSWLVPEAAETGDIGYGQVPKVGSRWFCYFSGTDANSSCGPSPFRLSTIGVDPFHLLVNTTTPTESGGKQLAVTIGGIRLAATVSNANGTKNPDGSVSVFLLVEPSGISTGVSVEVYRANVTKVAGPLALEKSVQGDTFSGNVTLWPGEYFLAFSAEGAAEFQNFGGAVYRVVVPGEAVSCAAPAAAGAFRVESGGTEIVAVGKEGVTLTTKTKVANTGTTALTNVSLTVPPELSGYLTARLSSANVSVNDSATLIVTFANIDRGLDINTSFTLLAGNATNTTDRKAVGSVPFSAKVTFLGQAATCPGAVGLSASPSSLSGSGAVGKPMELVFRIVNSGFADATITAKRSSGLEGATITAPAGILAGNSGSVKVAFTPAEAGAVAGSVTVETDQGNVSVPVSVTVSEDPTAGIEAAKADLDSYKQGLGKEQLAAVEDGLADAEADLNTADAAAAGGDSAKAVESLAAAKAKLAALKLVKAAEAAPPVAKPAQPELNPLLLALLGALAVLAIAFVLLRKRKKAAVKEETFEEEAEEALKEPAEEGEEEF